MIFSKQKRILSAFLSLAMIGTMVASVPFTASAATTKVGTSYSIFEKGWSTAKNGAAVGKANKGLCVEALKASASGATLNYAIYENKGWKSAKNGAAVGKANKKLYAEALKVSVSNSDYSVSYSIFEHGKWLSATNGKPVGTANKGFKIEALKISVTKKSVAPTTPTVASVSAVPDAAVAVGTDAATAIKSLPATVDVTLSDGTTKSGVAVTWAAPTTYDAKTVGTYAFTGTLASITGVENTDNVTATANVLVGDAKVASVVPTTDDIPVGGTTTFAFKNAAAATLATPTGTTYALEDSSYGSIDASGKFTAAKAGVVKVDVTAGSDKYTAIVNVYGTAAGVKLSADSATVLANGSNTTITATVVDANGVTVPTFNGTVNATITSNGAVKLVNASTNSYYTGAAILSNIVITNGKGTFQVVSSRTAALTDTISTNGLTTTNQSALSSGVSYGILAITTASVSAKALTVTPSLSGISVNNATASNFFTVKASVVDSTGTNVPTAQSITLTLTGPGSFSPSSAVTTMTLYSLAGTGDTSSVPVYATQGVAGNIVITATSGTLTKGTATVPAYVTTAPAKVTLTSKTGTTAAGVPFTLYTASLVDANGNVITSGTNAADAIKLTDNTSATGGKLSYYSVSNGQPTGIPLSANPVILPLSNGALTFAVENTTAASTADTITVTDTVLGFTQTAPYTYVVGNAAKAGITSTKIAQSVRPSQTVTITAQLQDINGNAVKAAGNNVVFQFSANSINATFPSGLTTPYVTSTDANGIASVTVAVPSTANTAQTFTVQSYYQYNPSLIDTSASYTFAEGVSYASSMLVTGNAATMAAGATTASAVTASLKNAIGGDATASTDTLKITTSNPGVVGFVTAADGLTANYDPNLTNTKTVNASGSPTVALTYLKAYLAGTSIITVTDISNPSIAPYTFPVTVNPGAAGVVTGATVYVNGAPVSASNGLTVSADTAVPVNVYNVDAGGNPQTSAAPTTYILTDNNNGSFRATAGGTEIKTVIIPANQQCTQIYYINHTANTYTTGFNALMLTGISVTALGSPVAGTAGTMTIGLGGAAAGFTGTLPITVTDAAASPSGAAATLPTSATFTGGSATVPVTLTSATAQTIAVTISGMSGSSASVTPTVGAASSATLSYTPASITHGASNVTSAATLVVKDQYGNAITGTGAAGTYTVTAGTGTGVTTTDYTIGSDGLFTFVGGSTKTGTYIVKYTNTAVSTVTASFTITVA